MLGEGKLFGDKYCHFLTEIVAYLLGQGEAFGDKYCRFLTEIVAQMLHPYKFILHFFYTSPNVTCVGIDSFTGFIFVINVEPYKTRPRNIQTAVSEKKKPNTIWDNIRMP